MKVLISGTDTSVLGKGVCIRTPIRGRQSRYDLGYMVLHPVQDKYGHFGVPKHFGVAKGCSVQTIPIIDRLDTGDVLRGVSGFL